MFVKNLCPGGSAEPDGALVEAIEKEFHSFEAMRNELSAAAVAIKVVFVFLFLFYFKTSFNYQHIILSYPSDTYNLPYFPN
jgi:superoxide dismutase